MPFKDKTDRDAVQNVQVYLHNDKYVQMDNGVHSVENTWLYVQSEQVYIEIFNPSAFFCWAENLSK